MNAFKKLALAAAVASVPMVGVAMEPLNDEGLSNVTGQDGISIGIELDALNLDVYIEDTDGLQNGTRDGAGFIGITGLVVNNEGDFTIDIDAGSAAGSASNSGVLQLAIKIDELSINKGSQFSIGVAGSDSTPDARDAEDGWGFVDDAKAAGFTEIIALGDIVLENLEMNIQLGPEAQSFLAIDTSTDLDLSLANFELIDASSSGGGSLFTESIEITNLGINGTTASITNGGLELTLGSRVGSDPTRVAVMGLGFGDSQAAAPLGNVYIDGLDLGGTKVTVSGH